MSPRPANRILIEVAVENVEGAVKAQQCKADRVELCSALELEGLTPSIGMIREVRREIDLPVVVMVRPRPGNFVCTRAEFEVIRRDVDAALAEGAAAVAVGFLTKGRKIDEERCAVLAEQCGPGRAVFHRAFDLLRDPLAGLFALADLGFARVLTSGGAATAVEGIPTLAKLVDAVDGEIEVLAGGGVRPENVRKIVRQTGCKQVHGAFSESVLTAMGPLGQSRRQVTSDDLIRRMRRELDASA
ncbi:MAG: copper homeostasis protein CutC [Phycisphaerae bacterium]|nr:copper homeostasis protein CutC [Tepidisphaeraceae bacterium]